MQQKIYSGNEVTIVVFKDTSKPSERSHGCYYNASGGIKKINARGVPIKKIEKKMERLQPVESEQLKPSK